MRFIPIMSLDPHQPDTWRLEPDHNAEPGLIEITTLEQLVAAIEQHAPNARIVIDCSHHLMHKWVEQQRLASITA